MGKPAEGMAAYTLMLATLDVLEKTKVLAPKYIQAILQLALEKLDITLQEQSDLGTIEAQVLLQGVHERIIRGKI